MIESLIGTIAIVALIIVVARQNGRIGLLEREIGALRSFVLASPPAVGETPKEVAEATAQAEQPASILAAEASPVETTAVSESPTTPEPVAEAGPWACCRGPCRGGGESGTARNPVRQCFSSRGHNPSGHSEKARTIETALGTRWAVWVGGLALALGGLFLIRYSIEAGIFGPAERLMMAFLLGVVLVGAANTSAAPATKCR